jgi:hypothetical protein
MFRASVAASYRTCRSGRPRASAVRWSYDGGLAACGRIEERVMFVDHPSRTFLPVMAALAAMVLSPAARAQHDEHAHHQDAGTAAIANLKLDGEKKWPTDASLRAGMTAIHQAFKAGHPAIHAGRQADAQYDALASRIESQVNSIVANCKLPPAADANLHYVIADLLQGVGLMRGQDPQRTRHDGAALVHGALRAYGQYFDDPDWKR